MYIKEKPQVKQRKEKYKETKILFMESKRLNQIQIALEKLSIQCNRVKLKILVKLHNKKTNS